MIEPKLCPGSRRLDCQLACCHCERVVLRGDLVFGELTENITLVIEYCNNCCLDCQ